MRKEEKVLVDPADWVSKQSFEDLEKERDALRNQVTDLKTKVNDLAQKARSEIDRLYEEYQKRTSKRTVLLESTKAGSDQIEGHNVETWEVGNKRYLVLAERPPGIDGSWVSDIRAEIIKHLPNAESVGMCIIPKGAAVKVVEIVPRESDDDPEVGQF